MVSTPLRFAPNISLAEAVQGFFLGKSFKIDYVELVIIINEIRLNGIQFNEFI
jgi:hypothetical protein